MPDRRRVLIFAEDPGALNMFTDLPGALASRGVEATLLAAGNALGSLKAAGAAHVPVRPGLSPESVLDEYRPTLYLAGTSSDPETLGLRLIEACKARKIPTLGAVDAAMNARRRFSGPFADDPLRYAPDRLLVVDDWTADLFEGLGYPRAKVVVCGHPHFDRVLAAKDAFDREGKDAVRGRALPHGLRGAQVVTFVSEGSARIMLGDGAAGGTDSWMRGWTGLAGRTELAFETLQPPLRELFPRSRLMFRLHPKDVPSDFEAYADRVDGFSAGGSPLELIFSSDLVVGTTSMLMAEAALLGVPILCLINQDSERAWVPVAGAFRHNFAASPAELAAALRGFLAGERTPSLPAATGPLRGATDRLADLISRAAKDGR